MELVSSLKLCIYYSLQFINIPFLFSFLFFILVSFVVLIKVCLNKKIQVCLDAARVADSDGPTTSALASSVATSPIMRRK